MLSLRFCRPRPFCSGVICGSASLLPRSHASSPGFCPALRCKSIPARCSFDHRWGLLEGLQTKDEANCRLCPDNWTDLAPTMNAVQGLSKAGAAAQFLCVAARKSLRRLFAVSAGFQPSTKTGGVYCARIIEGGRSRTNFCASQHASR